MVSAKKCIACLFLLGVMMVPSYATAARSKKQSAAKSGAVKSGSVNEVKSVDAFKAALKDAKAKKKPVALEFWMVGCGPCSATKPVFAASAKKHSDVAHIAISSNNAGNLLSEYKVHAFPTLVFLNSSGKEANRLEGAPSAAELDAKINTLK